MRPTFDNCSSFWTDDGSLRDVYIQQMELRHWQRFDSFVYQKELVYSFDGNPNGFPGSQNAFSNREGHHILSVILGSVSINCHFFVPEQLELDISPREILGPVEHGVVLDFIEQLSELLGLPADVTPENSEAEAYMTYSPVAHAWQVH